MLNVPDRLYQSLSLLRKELDLTELQQNINKYASFLACVFIPFAACASAHR